MYFKKLITIIASSSAVFAIAICLISCGHSITHTDRGTGLIIRIPLPGGSSLIDIKIGKIDSITTVLRGRTSYDSVASTSIDSATASSSGAFVGSEIVEVTPNDKIIGVGGRIVLLSSVIVILFIITSVVIVSIIINSSDKLASKKKVIADKEEKFNKKFENY